MIAGLIVCVAVLAAASAFGVAWRRRDGRLRAVSARGRPGSPVPADSPLAAEPPVPAEPPAGMLTAAELGEPLGTRATLVQFSTAFCAPCRATRRILADVAAMVDGVRHVELDAESHLELVRSLGIRRAPTVLVLGSRGEIVRRGSGQPCKADVIAALGDAVTTG